MIAEFTLARQRRRFAAFLDATRHELLQALSQHCSPVVYATDVQQVITSPDTLLDLLLIDACGQDDQAMTALTALQTRLQAGNLAALLLFATAPSADLADLIADTGADYLIWPANDKELLARLLIQLRRREQRQRHQRAYAQLQRTGR